MSERIATDPVNARRIQIRCAKHHDDLLKEAAAAADSDLGTWCLAHLLVAAGKRGEDSKDAPLVIKGDAAQKLRELAKRQGVSPSRLLLLALMAVK
jgi:hypothetical protein